MPFDSLHAPPEWRSPRPAPDAEPPLSRRDRVVAGILAAVLLAITLANCHALLRLCHVG